MSSLEILEETSKLDQHLASRELAERLYAHVQQLLAEGYDVAQLRGDVKELHRRARESGQTVQRDAYVEVLDALDEEHSAA